MRHNEDAEWLKDVENELGTDEAQENVKIVVSKVKKQVKTMPNWKIPGPDGVQGYWIKALTNLHETIALQLDKYLEDSNVPVWMATGKTLFCVKEIEEGNLVSNFKPITCLPLIWKLMTGIFS